MAGSANGGTPAGVVAPAAVAPAAVAVAAVTPLMQRTWRREAQRAVRLALTAVREARSRLDAAAAEGYEAATDLANDVLAYAYLHRMPLGALADVGEGRLLEAAGAKLLLRQQDALRRLRHSCEALAACADDAARAAASVACQDGGMTWQDGTPVFAALPLTAVAGMLKEVADALAADAAGKQGVCAALEAVAEVQQQQQRRRLALQQAGSSGSGQLGAGGRGSGGGSGLASGDESQPPPDVVMTVFLTTWLAAPHARPEACDQAVALLVADMAGF